MSRAVHREKDSSLQDLETRYNKSLERIALLEEELVAKAQLEEEVQRLKDDLRGASASLRCVRTTTDLETTLGGQTSTRNSS